MKATADDVGAISALNRVVQSRHAEAMPWLFKDVALGAAAITSLLRREETILLLARIDGEPLGYVYAQARRFPETPLLHAYAAVHVNHIAVREQARRSGIGRALVQAVKTIAGQRGIGRVTADTWSFNEEAASFFQSCGLVPYMVCCWHERED